MEPAASQKFRNKNDLRQGERFNPQPVQASSILLRAEDYFDFRRQTNKPAKPIKIKANVEGSGTGEAESIAATSSILQVAVPAEGFPTTPEA
jgi:hypothetical protein